LGENLYSFGIAPSLQKLNSFVIQPHGLHCRRGTGVGVGVGVGWHGD
jgi:hypothetical protein